MRRFVIVCVVCATASLSFAQAPPTDEPTDDQAPPDEAPPAAEQDVEVAPQPDQYSDTDPSALSDFRAPLAPYGNWVDDPTYGTVWIPHRAVVGDAFVPYQTSGHWAMDGANYVWMSDFGWGWLPFHYGRWVFIDGTGWAWIPGRAYAPSWVDWSVGDDYDYVGWYPTPPDFIWWDGVAVGLGVIPAVSFFYCPTPFLFDAHVHNHIIVGAEAQRIHLHARTLPAVATMRRGAFERGYVRGPAVSRLGAIRVVHTHPNQPQLARAQRYETPATARAVGATPPSAHRVKVPATRARQTAPYTRPTRTPPTTTPLKTTRPEKTMTPEKKAPRTPTGEPRTPTPHTRTTTPSKTTTTRKTTTPKATTTPTEAVPHKTTNPNLTTPNTPPGPEVRPRNPRESPRLTAPSSATPPAPTTKPHTPTTEPRTPTTETHTPATVPGASTPKVEHTAAPERTPSPAHVAPPEPVHAAPPTPVSRPPAPMHAAPPEPVHAAPPPRVSPPPEPVHSAPPPPAPVHTAPPPPPVHSAPPMPSPPPSPPHHRAPASEGPSPSSAPDPTPPASPSTPAPSSSEPGTFDSAAGVARS